MRVTLPQYAEKSELFAYLRSNEKSIISQKKSLPIKSDVFEWGCLPVNDKQTIKEDGSQLAPDEIEVNAIANLSGWCDSYMDVMIKDNWNKTIQDKSIVYALKNHDYSTDSITGKDAELYTKMFDLSYFGINSDVTKAQALMMRFTCCKDYDKKTFLLYRDGQIKQHSIGLRYLQIVLCLDSELEEDATYKKNWDKYYKQVINKEKVDVYGYFFAVIEAQILENSAVLFGANPNTGVYSSASKEEEIEQAVVETPEKIEPTVEVTQESKKRVIYYN